MAYPNRDDLKSLFLHGKLATEASFSTLIDNVSTYEEYTLLLQQVDENTGQITYILTNPPPPGPMGPPGPQGPPGSVGTIKGSVSDVSELPDTGEEGDFWLVNSELYVWNPDTQTWDDVGPFILADLEELQSQITENASAITIIQGNQYSMGQSISNVQAGTAQLQSQLSGYGQALSTFNTNLGTLTSNFNAHITGPMHGNMFNFGTYYNTLQFNCGANGNPTTVLMNLTQRMDANKYTLSGTTITVAFPNGNKTFPGQITLPVGTDGHHNYMTTPRTMVIKDLVGVFDPWEGGPGVSGVSFYPFVAIAKCSPGQHQFTLIPESFSIATLPGIYAAGQAVVSSPMLGSVTLNRGDLFAPVFGWASTGLAQDRYIYLNGAAYFEFV